MRLRRSLVKAADGDEAVPGWSDLEAVRPIGDEIDRRVRQLLADLASAGLKNPSPAAQHATRPERRPPAAKPIGELAPPPEPFSSTLGSRVSASMARTAPGWVRRSGLRSWAPAADDSHGIEASSRRGPTRSAQISRSPTGRARSPRRTAAGPDAAPAAPGPAGCS